MQPTIKLSQQTKALFVQIAMKVILEKENINELLDELQFRTDDEDLLHCINPPTVHIDWDTLESHSENEDEAEEEEEEGWFGLD